MPFTMLRRMQGFSRLAIEMFCVKQEASSRGQAEAARKLAFLAENLSRKQLRLPGRM